MKAIVYLTVALALSLLFSGCAGESSPSANLNDLVSKPEQFNGKTVTVDGIYVNGWEWTLIVENVTFTGSGDTKELKTVGASIWFAGFLPTNVRDGLYQYTSPGAGPQHYGKIRVTGLFESGGKYGNMNAYKYRITAEKVQLLDWTLPQ